MSPPLTKSIFLDRLVCYLMPYFLPMTTSMDLARAEILETLQSYGARSRSELLNVVQIIAFSMSALDLLMASRVDTSLSQSLRLRFRGCANNLNRSSQQAEKTLAARLKCDLPTTPAPPPNPSTTPHRRRPRQSSAASTPRSPPPANPPSPHRPAAPPRSSTPSSPTRRRPIDPPGHRWSRRPMLTTQYIQTEPGLTFDVSTAGPATGPLVLMLHGFGVSRYFWDAQVEALGQAGYHAVAPNQRGNAAGARPDPADHARYRIDLLIADALAIVAALGNPARFHLAGHDWGGSLSWHIADRYPERLASLTMLSPPTPAGLQRGPRSPGRRAETPIRPPRPLPRPPSRPGQPRRRRQMAPHPPRRERSPPGQDRKTFVGHRQPASHGGRAGLVPRQRRHHQPVGPTKVPTLYIWGNADDTVGRAAAEGTVDFIAAPYRFAELPGVGHYAADQVPDTVNDLMLQHLASTRPVSSRSISCFTVGINPFE